MVVVSVLVVFLYDEFVFVVLVLASSMCVSSLVLFLLVCILCVVSILSFENIFFIIFLFFLNVVWMCVWLVFVDFLVILCSFFKIFVASCVARMFFVVFLFVNVWCLVVLVVVWRIWFCVLMLFNDFKVVVFLLSVLVVSLFLAMTSLRKFFNFFSAVVKRLWLVECLFLVWRWLVCFCNVVSLMWMWMILGGCLFCFWSFLIFVFIDFGVNFLCLSVSSRKRIIILVDCKFLFKYVYKFLVCLSLFFSFVSFFLLFFVVVVVVWFVFVMMVLSLIIFVRVSTSFKSSLFSARSVRKRLILVVSLFVDLMDFLFVIVWIFISLVCWVNFSVDIVFFMFICVGEMYARSV